MRRVLLALAMIGGIGLSVSANAKPMLDAQFIQYHRGFEDHGFGHGGFNHGGYGWHRGFYHDDWRAREWHHRRWACIHWGRCY